MEKYYPIIAILIISGSAGLAGVMIGNLNDRTQQAIDEASLYHEWTDWMKEEHFRIILHDTEMVEKAWKARQEAYELAVEYDLVLNRTLEINRTFEKKVVSKLYVYESYMKSTYAYFINRSLGVFEEENYTINSKGEFNFIITKDYWEFYGFGEEDKKLFEIINTYSFFDEGPSIRSHYYTINKEGGMLLMLDSDRFPDSTVNYLTEMYQMKEGWINLNFNTLNSLLYHPVKDLSDESTEKTNIKIDYLSARDFIAIFVSVTTIGTVLASAISNRIDGEKMDQNFKKIREILKYQEDDFYKPGKMNLYMLYGLSILSIIVIIVVIFNWVHLIF